MTNSTVKSRIETLDKALKMIEANPEYWDQSNWHCGTSHCLAGFCDIVEFNKGKETPFDLKEDFIKAGGLQGSYGSDFAVKNSIIDYLFRASNTLAYIKAEIEHLKKTQKFTGLDSHGHNSRGWYADADEDDTEDGYFY